MQVGGDRPSFLPAEYASSVTEEERSEILTMPTEKIKEVLKGANTFKKQVILQDLVAAGMEGKKIDGKNTAVLAAELFLKVPNEVQQDFFKRIKSNDDQSFCKIFRDAILTNFVYHEAVGSKEFSETELKIEKAAALNLDKHIKSIFGEV